MILCGLGFFLVVARFFIISFLFDFIGALFFGKSQDNCDIGNKKVFFYTFVPKSFLSPMLWSYTQTIKTDYTNSKLGLMRWFALFCPSNRKYYLLDFLYIPLLIFMFRLYHIFYFTPLSNLYVYR